MIIKDTETEANTHKVRHIFKTNTKLQTKRFLGLWCTDFVGRKTRRIGIYNLIITNFVYGYMFVCWLFPFRIPLIIILLHFVPSWAQIRVCL